MLKNISLLGFIIFLFIGVISCDNKTNKKSIVIKDCTGVYLQMEGGDFRVCNRSKVENIPNGTEVIATFRSSSTCEADDEIVCMMYHPSQGDIRISKVKTR
ncbi:hypothetical protein N9E62_01255 [Salibacteraceae bacterium]|jgi:hypothetical protein|nr:hypothetical protein [Salibacteraceae bacterium]